MINMYMFTLNTFMVAYTFYYYVKFKTTTTSFVYYYCYYYVEDGPPYDILT